MMKKFLIKVNGNQYEVEVEEIKGAASHGTHASPVKSETVAEKAPAPKAAAPKKDNVVPEGASTVTAPMPGTILKVNVKQGDAVKKGQVLLVLEAMKMENEIVAPADGTVATINVGKGTSVNAGDVLVSIK